jgi:dolichol-phosphate mannosyltransferase
LGLPAYNEAAAIKPLFEKIRLLQLTLAQPLCVLFYDDGSRDHTRQEVQAWCDLLSLVYLDGVENRGLGAGMNALLQEFYCRGASDDLLVVMDCDNTHDPQQITQMLTLLQQDAYLEVVIASRYRAGAISRGVPRHRAALSLACALLYKILHPIANARDYSCGYRAYRHGAIARVHARYPLPMLKEPGFACMVELLLKLRQVRARVREIPLRLAYDQKVTPSKMDLSANSLRLLKKLLAWRWMGLE